MRFAALAAAILTLTGCGDSSILAPYRNPKVSLQRRIEDLFRRLTADEKRGLLEAKGVPRLKIPPIRMVEGTAGIAPGIKSARATAFPAGIAIAATWNPEIAAQEGRVVAQEAISLGYDQVLAPAINLARTPLAGRNFEGYGEDGWLASRMAIAYIGAMQAEGIIATVRQFGANTQETSREKLRVTADRRTLEETYLSPFRAAIEEAGAWAIMAPLVSGSAEEELLNNVVKKDWGFRGYVVSDRLDARSLPTLLNAGIDVRIAGVPISSPGDLANSMGALDDSVRRVLRVLFISGFMDRAEAAEKPPVDTYEQRAVARAAAVQSIVLLKNDGDVLPLDPARVRSIALIGPNAEINRLGGGGRSAVFPEYSWKPADGIRERAAGRMQVAYALGAPMEGEQAPSASHLKEAVEIAGRSDIAIVFAGLSAGLEGEGADRKTLGLPAGQDALIEAVARVNRNTVVILQSGSPVATGSWAARVPTILQAWYGGQEGGHAIADVLFGDANPSGKLPVTFPASMNDSLLPQGAGGADYPEGIFIGYRRFDNKGIEPAFAFGHGLSYSKFSYSDLTITPASPRYGQLVTVRLHVTNTGSRAGAEVVQLYLRDVKSSVPRPPKELKGFQRVELKPGESKLVTLTLDRRSMWFYDPLVKDWAVEPGEFEVFAGSSSRDIRLRGKFDLYE